MSQTRSWVAYVGPFLFPEGEAASRRILGVAQSLVMSGRDVVVCSGNAGTPSTLSLSGHSARIRHVPLGDRPRSMRAHPLQALSTLVSWGRAATRWLENQPTRPTHVIVYGGQASYALNVHRWCRRNGVAVVQDVVEWHEPTQFAGGRLNPGLWSSELAMRAIYPRSDGIIAISTFLQRTYETQLGERITVVPPTTLTSEPKARNTERRPLTLAYAGSPGNKEVLAPLVEATIALADAGHAIQLRLAGVDTSTLESISGRTAHTAVTALGRISYEDVTSLVSSADFTVLLRNSSRCTEAGFPTKFVESFAVGTPVIGNLTGDLAQYLKDGQTGLVVNSISREDVQRALKRALILSPAQRQSMSGNASRSARSHFDPRAYVRDLDVLLRRSARD